MMNPMLRLKLAVGVLAAFAAGAGLAGAEEISYQCHTLPAPRVAYIADSSEQEELAELLRHVVPARVEFVPLNYNDLNMHHLCDKPLEESKEDQAYVQQQAAAYADSALARLAEFDLIVAQFQPRGRSEEQNERIFQIQRRLVERVQAGAALVFINPSWETTFNDTPLAEVLPVRFDGRHRAWAYSPVRPIIRLCAAFRWKPAEPQTACGPPRTRARNAPAPAVAADFSCNCGGLWINSDIARLCWDRGRLARILKFLGGGTGHGRFPSRPGIGEMR